MPSSAVLLIHCPDQKGIVAAISTFLYSNGANILHADQHQDNEASLFFMRIEWDLAGFALDDGEFRGRFQVLADRFRMQWKMAYSEDQPAVAIFVSRYQHCLLDLLHRHDIGELRCKIAFVLSNHEDARELSAFYRVPFHHIPTSAENRAEAEDAQLALLAKYNIELLVLARYMQVLSPHFVKAYRTRIVNVHHSFLPAFSGARPYHAAYERGVKLIGATSHYVTEVLDEGPIIEQDVLRISHRDQISDLIQKGRDLERVVLSRAVRWHLDHRVLQYSGKTVVFD